MDGMEQVMVIVPIDADEDKAHYIGQEHRDDRCENHCIDPLGHLNLENHDGDDHRDYTITEGFQSTLGHFWGASVAPRDCR